MQADPLTAAELAKFRELARIAATIRGPQSTSLELDLAALHKEASDG